MSFIRYDRWIAFDNAIKPAFTTYVDLIMYLKRVQIDDGFLEGLDVQLSQGLNTIIGARGTGKTSLLELIRFCLGTSGFYTGNHKKSFEHALSVIGDGKITVSLEQNGQEILVSRGASDATPYSTAVFTPPIILSQTEVETVGLLSQGRLEIIDSFISNLHDFEAHDSITISQIQSVSREVDALIRERAETLDSLLEIQSLDTALNEISEKEKQIANYSANAAGKQATLQYQATMLSTLSIQDAYVERFIDRLTGTLDHISNGLYNLSNPDKWMGEIHDDPLKGFRAALSDYTQTIHNGFVNIKSLLSPMNHIRSEIHRNKATIEESNRTLRREFEAIVQGAGAISREATSLRERRAKLENLAAHADDQKLRIDALISERNTLLNRMQDSRSSKFQWRKKICSSINLALGPKIRVKIEESSQIDAYVSLLSEILRGSGLKYNEVAKTIAMLISPRELGELVQHSNYEQLAKITGITMDRAAKLLTHLRDVGVGEILTCPIEDIIAFQLLDGSTYKDLSLLSTGQRCTVVLPIILEHTNRIIIVDQPEDHIDNAFIAETLIKSIKRRSEKSQIIFTTHNANIPVLGNANRVIQMESDGRRGYVKVENPLSDQAAIEAISNVMEGGKDAFDYRAKFYRGSDK